MVYSQGREKRSKDGVEQARAGAGTRRSRKGGHGWTVWEPIAMGRSLDFILIAVKAFGGI